MASSTMGRGKNVHTKCLSAVLALVSMAAGASLAYGGYTYQTRYTESSPNAARQNHVACLLGDGQVGLFGGEGRTDMELFDPETERFVSSRATRTFADFAGVTLEKGNALLIDGEHDCVYDYLTDQYLGTGKLYSGGAVRFPVLVSLPDGRVFVCGGQDSSSRSKSDCGLFDPRTLQFEALGDLVVARAFHTAVLINSHQVLIAGGYGYASGSSSQTALDSLELFDIDTGRSGQIRTALTQARYAHSSVLLPDGRVLILGGTRSDKEPWLQSAEIFDPTTSTISAGPSLGLGRSGAKTVAMPSGRIAVFGGRYDARTVELYDPDTGTFALAESLMLDPRSTGFTATGLDSGAVLLVGGLANVDGDVVADAEVFQEMESEAASRPAVTLDSIRALLADSDPAVVSEATEWLVGLGPQVQSILETLAGDGVSTLSRQANSILESITAREYPDVWCVEVWGAEGRLDSVWLDSFECSTSWDASDPDQHVQSILQATEGTDFTYLTVRFPTHAPYADRVKLFNLVGWTNAPSVVLGDDLSQDDLEKVFGSLAK
jgi:hypothetical protein